MVTPSVLRNQYSWPAAAKGKHGSTQAVAEFYGEFFSNEDLSSFFTEIDEPVQSLAPTHVKGNLANDQGHIEREVPVRTGVYSSGPSLDEKVHGGIEKLPFE